MRLIDPVIISLIIAGGGLILTAIFNSKNINRNATQDMKTDHERAVKTEAKLDNICDSIKDLKRDTANDMTDLKKSVSNEIASLKEDIGNISHASSKVQLRQEKLQSTVENHERRIHVLERWKDKKGK